MTGPHYDPSKRRNSTELQRGVIGSHDWWTPQVVIDLVRAMFPGGFIDLAADAASAKRMGAADHFSVAESYLDDHGDAFAWAFCNPPGGKTRLTQQFWVKCAQEFAAGRMTELIWLSFSLDTLQTTQGKGVSSILDFPTWVPAKRLPYYSPERGEELPGVRPSAITFLTNSIGRREDFFAACARRIPGVKIAPCMGYGDY